MTAEAVAPFRAEPKPIVVRRSLTRFFALVLAMLAIAVASGLLTNALIRRGWLTTDLSPLALLLALVPMTFLLTAWHEAGHVLAGRLVGFRFLLFVAGPLMILNTVEGLRFGYNRITSLFGGIAASIPLDHANLRRRRFVVVAGGPVASLILFVLCAAAGGALRERAPAWSGLLTFAALLAGVQALLTLLPIRSGGFTSDGRQMLTLLRGGRQADLHLALILLQSALIGGVRPRDLDPVLVEQALAGAGDEKGPLGVSAHLIAYSRSLDRGETADAGRHLDEALLRRAAYPRAYQPGIALEAAYFLARYGDDPATARAWLTLGSGGAVEAHSRLRAEAAVLLAEGDPAAARAKVEKALGLLGRTIDRGSTAAEKEWLEAIARQASGS